MVELTPEFMEKRTRLHALEKDPGATAREAIDLIVWFADFDSRTIDDSVADEVISVLSRSGLSAEERSELTELCLRRLIGACWMNEQEAWKRIAEHVLKS